MRMEEQLNLLIRKPGNLDVLRYWSVSVRAMEGILEVVLLKRPSASNRVPMTASHSVTTVAHMVVNNNTWWLF